MMKKPQRLPIIWTVVAQVAAVVHSNKRRLAMTTMERDGYWQVLAVEGENSEGPEGFLGDHGHDYIGKFPNLQAATERMRNYAAAWLKKRVKIEACDCKPLRKKRGSGAGRAAHKLDRASSPARRSRRVPARGAM